LRLAIPVEDVVEPRSILDRATEKECAECVEVPSISELGLAFRVVEETDN
jgi:hypothetical protein